MGRASVLFFIVPCVALLYIWEVKQQAKVAKTYHQYALIKK